MRQDITIVGAGVSGLTCAVTLKEAGFDVRVVARERWPMTVSAIAAAVWYPYKAWPPERMLAWARRSYERFAELAADARTGVLMREGLEVYRRPMADPWWKAAVPDFERAPPPPGYRDAWRFTSPVVEMPVYLPWLERRFLDAGGRIEAAEVRTLDLGGIVVDCAGLGARTLVPDPSVTANFGQIVRVENPGLTRWLIDEEHPDGMAYVIPRSTDCILGGTAEDGRQRPEPDDAACEAILRRCIALEPRLAGARVLGGAAGFRPVRPSVRLERETIGRTIVVHDYGHGGAGVTLSWGCAEEVLRLVERGGTSP